MKPRFATELARWGPDAAQKKLSLVEAEAYCRRLARSHYENFTVASWLLPSQLQQHFYNVYAYCRWSDDLADELPDRDQSLQLLDWWESELIRCVQGEASHPVLIALEQTIRRFETPLEPFRNLLIAFRLDQAKRRYATFEELHGYCRNSANPVGRIVLQLGEVSGDEQNKLSDSICTGLQLANFCQDVAADFRQRDRIYLPEESYRRFGLDEDDFRRGEDDDRFRGLLEYEANRAEQFLLAGEPLIGMAPRWLQVDLSLFIGGGRALLRQLRRHSYDVWTRRPTVSKWMKLRLLASAWFASRHAGPAR